MSKEMLTVLKCDWCENSVPVPAKKSLWPGRFKPADYPDSWDIIKEENVCDECKQVAMKALQDAKHKCQNNGGKKKTSAVNQ